MPPIENLNIINIIKGWNDNKEFINDYMKNKEGFNKENRDVTILGLSIGVFIIIFLLSIVLLFFSIYLLAVNWNNLPDWAKVIGLLSIFFFPLITIIVVLIAKQEYIRKPSVRFKSPLPKYKLL